MNKRTLVLGASENPERYANKAVLRLRAAGHDVVAVGKVEGRIADTPIRKEWPEDHSVDTLTLYVNPLHQKPFYDRILKLAPKRIIFNPGTENPELETLAEEQGIETVEACTLVLLAVGEY